MELLDMEAGDEIEVVYKDYIISVFSLTENHHEVKYRYRKESLCTYLTSMFDTRERAIQAGIKEIDEECRKN